jgi:hypothetical protein
LQASFTISEADERGEFSESEPDINDIGDRLAKLGNLRWVDVGDGEVAVITSRGRLALACFAAVNARMA